MLYSSNFGRSKHSFANFPSCLHHLNNGSCFLCGVWGCEHCFMVVRVEIFSQRIELLDVEPRHCCIEGFWSHFYSLIQIFESCEYLDSVLLVFKLWDLGVWMSKLQVVSDNHNFFCEFLDSEFFGFLNFRLVSFHCVVIFS